MNQQDYKVLDKFYGQELLHTPEGVRDIYGTEFANKLQVQQGVHDTMNAYGFRDIQTPTYEFFDVFNKERGSVASKEMFKFFDRDNNTLVLRPDVTPAIARCVAKYFKEEDMQLRFCYVGNTFVNTSRYHGKLQEVTQVGAELFNDDSSDADAEMIALTIECLLKSGLEEFQLEIGHADFFRALVEEACFSATETARLQELITSKNFFGVEDFLDNVTISNELKEIFLKLPELLGDFEETYGFVTARTNSARVIKALDRLQKLEQILKLYGFLNYITIDLSMLSTYSYYTGVIFKAYTYGNGEALASGGRYDGLVKQFGKDTPAIGLAIVLDQLMLALSRQNLLTQDNLGGDIVLYPQELRETAVKMAASLREEGKKVQLLRKSSRKNQEEYEAYRQRIGADRLIVVTAETERN